MDGAFFGCSALKKAVLPDGIVIGKEVFEGCPCRTRLKKA